MNRHARPYLAALLAATGLLHAGALFAQACSPSDAPQPANGRISGAWWSRYSAWCSQCGGTPFQDNTGGGCRPGPNWGGKGGGGGAGLASTGDPATDAARIAADMFSRLNPQTPQQIGLAMSASMATGILSAGIAEMFRGPSPEQIRQRQVQAEFARQEELRRARERAEAERQAHERVMNMLKRDSSWDGQLALKTEGDPGALQLKAGTSFFGQPSNPGGLELKTGDAAEPVFMQQQQDLSRALDVVQLHADLISDGEREKAMSNLLLGRNIELPAVPTPRGVPVKPAEVSQFVAYRQKYTDAFARVEEAREKMQKAGADREQIAQARKVLEDSINEMKKMLPPEAQQQATPQPQPAKPDKKAEEDDDKLRQANKLFDESSQLDAKADKALQEAKKGFEDSAKEWQSVQREAFDFLNRLAKNGAQTDAAAR